MTVYIAPSKDFEEIMRSITKDLHPLKNPCARCGANWDVCPGADECFSDKFDYFQIEIKPLGLIEHRKIWENCGKEPEEIQ